MWGACIDNPPHLYSVRPCVGQPAPRLGWGDLDEKERENEPRSTTEWVKLPTSSFLMQKESICGLQGTIIIWVLWP